VERFVDCDRHLLFWCIYEIAIGEVHLSAIGPGCAVRIGSGDGRHIEKDAGESNVLADREAQIARDCLLRCHAALPSSTSSRALPL
jgi:hypothetical protein